MTLAEARKLSPRQLAERLLGAAGVSGDYVEAKVSGNGGLMIHQPGINGVDLYRRPTSAGFVGLCQVERVHVSFSTSRHDTPGDPPHHVTDFWKSTAFAMLAPTDKRIDSGDWKRENRDCAQLAPVAGRTDPMFFTVAGDKPADAYFAMRAAIKAQIAAGEPGRKLGCKIIGPDWGACSNAVATLKGIAVGRIHYVAVNRCADGAGWCVTANWMRSIGGNEYEEIELTIYTDAAKVDPPADFNVVAIDISAGTSVDD
ncbi:MAG TPA: hypothetical protein VF485_14140 [Sphingomonas sp.]